MAPPSLEKGKSLSEDPRYDASLQFVDTVNSYLGRTDVKAAEIVQAGNPNLEALMDFADDLTKQSARNSEALEKDPNARFGYGDLDNITGVKSDEASGILTLEYENSDLNIEITKGENRYDAIFWEAPARGLGLPDAVRVNEAIGRKEAGQEAVKLDASAKRSVEKTKLNSIKALSALKIEVRKAPDNLPFDQLMTALNLSGTEINGYFSAVDHVSKKEDLKDPRVLESIAKRIYGEMKDKNLKAFADFFDSTEEEAKNIVANLYAAYIAARFVAHYEELYVRTGFEDFRKVKGNEKYKIQRYNVEIAGPEKMTVFFEGNEDFEEAFDQYKLDHPVRKGPDATRAEGDLTATELKQKAFELSQQPIGGLLKVLGYGKKDEQGVTGFEKIIKGEADGVVAMILGLFGYKEFGGEAYEGLKDLIPEKYSQIKTKLEKWEKKARDSKYAYGAKEKGKADAESAKKYPEKTAAEFMKIVESGKAPEGGLSLKEPVILVTKSLKVNLESGGKLIVKAGNSLNAKGVEGGLSAKKGSDLELDSSRFHELELAYRIPAGTVFTDKVTFEVVQKST